MSFYVGDFSDEALVVVPSRGGEDLDLDGYTIEASLFTPTGITTAPTATVDGDDVLVSFSSVFFTAGIYRVRLTAVKGTTERVGLDDTLIIVEDRDGWHTLHTAREEWPGAPLNDVQLYTLLTLAREEVEAFARTETSLVTLRQAQLMQMKTLWNAAKVDATGTLGDGTFQINPRPLDWMVRQILRPKTAVPKVM